MKTRIISSILLAIICIPSLVYGGILIKLLAAVVAFGAAYEFTSIRDKRFNVILYLSIVIFVSLINLVDAHQVGFILIYIIFLFFLSIISEDFTLDDASSAFMVGMILAFAASAVIKMYETDFGFELMLMILLASFGCDISALFVGMAFGKHPLNPRVSPKKTWEGAIGGWFFGSLLSFAFAYFFLPSISLTFRFIICFTLPIVAQIGDLSFSLIKRNYAVKDFGSIIPGHGGILDRADSLLFCLIYFISMAGIFI